MAVRYCDIGTWGIHSRLRNIIRKSGGYNRKLAAYCLMKEYEILNFDIAYEMAKNEYIRKEIDAVGLDVVISLFKKSIELQNIRLRQVRSLLGNSDTIREYKKLSKFL